MADGQPNMWRRFTAGIACSTPRGLTAQQQMLTNDDLKPVPSSKRLWTSWNFVGFWLTDSLNISTWLIASSMIVDGLAWWQAFLCALLGYTLASVFICLSGRAGAVYHVGFPVISRASFGIWGSMWPVLCRSVMACVWYGIQAYIGGHCVYVIMIVIFTNYKRDKMINTFPPNSGTTTADYLSFFLFWLISLPFLYISTRQVRQLFLLKAVFCPPASIAFVVWVVCRAGGPAAALGGGGGGATGVQGVELWWRVVRATMTCLASFASFVVGDADFSRFARRRRAALLPQLLTIPLGFVLSSLVSIVVASAARVIIIIHHRQAGAKEEAPPPQSLWWSPISMLELFATGESRDRFGALVLAFFFAVAQLGTNVASSAMSAGSDLAALLPRFINIRRGSFVCAFVGLVVCPYRYVVGPDTFTVFFSTYSVLLSPVAGVMFGDYYLVRCGYLEPRKLYDARRSSPYYFGCGVHFRGYFAYLAGISINVIGLAGDLLGSRVPRSATYIYRFHFFTGFFLSAISYFILCVAFPITFSQGRRTLWSEIAPQPDHLHPDDCETGSSSSSSQCLAYHNHHRHLHFPLSSESPERSISDVENARWISKEEGRPAHWRKGNLGRQQQQRGRIMDQHWSLRARISWRPGDTPLTPPSTQTRTTSSPPSPTTSDIPMKPSVLREPKVPDMRLMVAPRRGNGGSGVGNGSVSSAEALVMTPETCSSTESKRSKSGPPSQRRLPWH